MTSRSDIVCGSNRLSKCPMFSRKLDLGDLREFSKNSLEGFLFLNQNRWNPYLYHLINVNWHVAGTLTWRQPEKRRPSWDSENLRRYDFKQLTWRTAEQLKLRGKAFGFYHTMEWGMAGECHFHFLIAADGLEHLLPSVVASTMHEFANQNIGLSVVKPFDEAKQFAGVSYCLKREYDGYGEERERFDYLSPKLVKMLQPKLPPQPL